MNPLTKAGITALIGVAAAIAAAQDTTPHSTPNAPADAPPKKSTAQIDAGEPRADTSPGSGGSSAGPAGAPGPAASNRSAASPAGGGGSPPGVDGTSQGARTSATAAAGAKPSRPAAARAFGSAPKAPGAVDRLNLGTATVTGDSEQPKVMYIVPWKKAGIGDLSGKPMNSLLDEALAPVDRDEFKREVAYYDAVKADASPNGGANPAAKQGEK